MDDERELEAAVAATLAALAAVLADPEATPADQQAAVTAAEDDANNAWLLLLLLLFRKRYDEAGGPADRRAAAEAEYLASRRALILGVIGTSVERLRLGADPARFIDVESTLVARTEVETALNGGLLTAALLSGSHGFKKWVTANDERVRHAHAEADGQTVPIDGLFTVGGFQAFQPRDASLPAHLSVNCRCHAIPTGAPIVASTEPSALPNGWRGVIAGLDVPTGDGRMLMTPPGGLRTREYPMSLTRKHVGSDDIWIGTVDYAWVEDGVLMGEGSFDLGGEDGQQAARQLVAGLETVSIDPDEVTWTQVFHDPSGSVVELEQAVEYDDEGYAIALKEGYKVFDAMSDWRLSGLAVVSIPAYDVARIEPVYDYVSRTAAEADEDAAFEAELKKRKKKGKRWPSYEEMTVQEDGQLTEDAVVAAVGGQTFNSAFFEDPKLDGPTPLTVTPEGRIFGHAALFDSCYMAPGGRQGCLKPPQNGDFSRFEVHGAKMDDGSIKRVGVITFGQGHSSAGSLKASQRQYADISTAAAKVVVGEDKFGVWVSGEVLDTFKDRAYDLLLSPLSGHWEPDLDNNGKLAMIAAHVVVVPGYAVPRVAAAYGEDGTVEAVSFRAPVARPNTDAAPLDAAPATEVPAALLFLQQIRLRDQLAKR